MAVLLLAPRRCRNSQPRRLRYAEHIQRKRPPIPNRPRLRLGWRSLGVYLVFSWIFSPAFSTSLPTPRAVCLQPAALSASNATANIERTNRFMCIAISRFGLSSHWRGMGLTLPAPYPSNLGVRLYFQLI